MNTQRDKNRFTKMTPSDLNWRHWGWSRETSSRQQRLSRAQCGRAPAGPTLDQEELQGRGREGRKKGMRTKAEIPHLLQPPSSHGHAKDMQSGNMNYTPSAPTARGLCLWKLLPRCSSNTAGRVPAPLSGVFSPCHFLPSSLCSNTTFSTRPV